MEGMTMETQFQKIVDAWPGIQDVFSIPHDKKGYNRLLRLLENLIDEVGEDETHPLASLMETVGSLIESC